MSTSIRKSRALRFAMEVNQLLRLYSLAMACLTAEGTTPNEIVKVKNRCFQLAQMLSRISKEADPANKEIKLYHSTLGILRAAKVKFGLLRNLRDRMVEIFEAVEIDEHGEVKYPEITEDESTQRLYKQTQDYIRSQINYR